MKLVLVEWVDSSHTVRWTPMDEIEQDTDPCFCRSVGWLAKKSSTGLVIVPHVSAERGNAPHQGLGTMTIPLKAVTKLTVLRK